MLALRFILDAPWLGGPRTAKLWAAVQFCHQLPGQFKAAPRAMVRLVETRSLAPVSLNDTNCPVIRSFRDKTAEAVFNGGSPKGFPADLVKVARRKLRYLNAAGDLGDLRSPPGNLLEALAGDRKGQHSIG
jgi:proteic killer suppression protein